MAVYFLTQNANALLQQFNARIEQTATEGKITTWERSSDGKYYTHKASQWSKKAWLKATADADKLRFNVIRPAGINISSTVYAYYHGHLIETFLNHFDRDFSRGEATAMPSQNDDVSA
ncbi:hypothetical protein [Dyella sp. Tek66A03]|uniref:hypothetical protein n=1 Tax=Dyella sp. Tek66A03 TaxID=3458298 RepID=UPI00403EF0E5